MCQGEATTPGRSAGGIFSISFRSRSARKLSSRPKFLGEFHRILDLKEEKLAEVIDVQAGNSDQGKPANSQVTASAPEVHE